MTEINTKESIHTNEGQDHVWSDTIPMLNDKDFRIRNRGVNILLHRLSHKSKFQFLQKDEQSYREGFDLLLERLEDKNYTVRTFTVTTLAVVLEATEGKEEYEDIYQKSITGIFRAMEDKEPWVREHAIDIVEERIKQVKKKRFS